MTGRLIEADKAIEATWEQPTYTDPLNVLTEVRDRIRELPTVDAIPVEWMQKTLNEAKNANHFEFAYYVHFILTCWEAEQRKEE